MTLPSGAPLGEFAPQRHEYDYALTCEHGAIPTGLRGTLYRNGIGRWESGGSPVGHIFDGDGMVSMFAIDGDEVRFRNRYVRTEHYLKGNTSRGPAGRGTGTLRGNGGVLANALRWPLSNLANTNVVLHAGHLLALFEAGKPHLLHPDTLETSGLYDFAGKLRGMGCFSAHPKVDYRTGELFNFGTTIFPTPGLAAYKVDAAGKLHKLAQLRLLPPLLNHDMGLTERYLVFVLDPMVVSPTGLLPVLAGFKPLSSAIRFDETLGTQIVLIPRDGGRQIHAHTEALLHFHIANCYDEGDETVIDLCRYTDGFDAMWARFHSGYNQATNQPSFGGPVARLRVRGSGRVLREDLSERRTEFPQIDTRFTGRPHRYTYALQIPDARAAEPTHSTSADPIVARSGNGGAGGPRPHREVGRSAVISLDHRAGTESAYPIPHRGTACEPVFAPRSPSSAEGDGWLLTITYDRDEDRSKLVILDAADPGDGPVYVGALRHRLPIGLHGSFTARLARRSAFSAGSQTPQ